MKTLNYIVNGLGLRFIKMSALFAILVLTILPQLMSCKKDFLNVRPNIKQVKLSASDCQALLDNYSVMNTLYPIESDISCDDYYVEDAKYNSIPTRTQYEKDIYRWDAMASRTVSSFSWSAPYTTIYNANVVLKTLEDDTGNLDIKTVNTLNGSALFFRAYVLHQLAQVYCDAYNPALGNDGLGLPFRTSPDVEEKSERGTVKLTYDQIIKDLKRAASLLPISTSIPSRPNKVAAYAALARTYLSMEDYVNAAIYADSSLKINDGLLDYNDLDQTSNAPINRFNSEVLFQSIKSASNITASNRAMVDSTLFENYDTNDLRKSIMFKPIGKGYQFVGSYAGDMNTQFSGLANDELFLIRAECYARANKLPAALHDLNTLLIKRYRIGTFTPILLTDKQLVLKQILLERRKELFFRCLRWSDLRRLNRDPNFAVTLYRKLGGVTYSLPPKDIRYTLLLPEEALLNTNYPQNLR